MRQPSEYDGGSEEKEDWVLCPDGSWWLLKNGSWVLAEPDIPKILNESMVVVRESVAEKRVIRTLHPNRAYPPRLRVYP
jgi:hypothetical protein